MLFAIAGALGGALGLAALAFGGFRGERPPDHPPHRAAARPVFTPTGVAPLTLARPLRLAAADTLRHDPAAAHIGPGCDGRDEITVELHAADVTLTVMAMADGHGVIEEIIAIPQGLATGANDAQACRARMQAFARALAPHVGPPGPESHARMAVAETFGVGLGAHSRVLARWFAGGASCDISLTFRDTPGP